MRFPVLLACVALIPVAAVAGFFAHQDPSMDDAIGSELRQVGDPQVAYYFVVTKGQYQGQADDAGQILRTYPTEKALKEAGAPPHKWVKATCTSFTSSGHGPATLEPEVVNHCVVVEITRNQAEKLTSGTQTSS